MSVPKKGMVSVRAKEGDGKCQCQRRECKVSVPKKGMVMVSAFSPVLFVSLNSNPVFFSVSTASLA